MHILYKKAYPSIKNGYLPTQKILGKLSYPTHTFDYLTNEIKYLSPEKVLFYEEYNVSVLKGKYVVYKTGNKWIPSKSCN